jgi:hypothetical protein
MAKINCLPDKRSVEINEMIKDKAAINRKGKINFAIFLLPEDTRFIGR